MGEIRCPTPRLKEVKTSYEMQGTPQNCEMLHCPFKERYKRNEKVELGYNDLGLCYTPATASNIL